MKIGLLATGDELINGDILNTNGQTISQALFDAGFSLGSQVATSDKELEIQQALEFLQQQHQVIIITGGLGPTSDDRTRFALAKATTNGELFFSDESWQAIIDRLNRYRLKIHESNKQQAYFPHGAEILPNPNGTAAGCRLKTEKHLFFMLPGPPRECLPMFFDYVLPYLQENYQETKFKQKKWRLFGVSEGEIAAELDELVKDFPVTTGYRWDYPYLEFKILHEATVDIAHLFDLLEKRIESISICSSEQTALEVLLTKLAKLPKPLAIHDSATAGLLQYRLSQIDTIQNLRFVNKQDADIVISGLSELWQSDKTISHTHLEINGTINGKPIHDRKEIPFRSRQVVDYAIEYIAYRLTQLLV